MKTNANALLPTALGAHYATRQTTVAYGLRITRTDAVVYGFTSHDIDDTVNSVLYKARPGMNISQIAIASGLAVSNLELIALRDSSVFTDLDALSGVWRNAKFLIFRYNWASLAGGIEPVLAGLVGEIEPRLTEFLIELRGLQQYWQQPQGSATSITCRYRYGSTSKYNGGLCMKNISAAPYTMPFTVTSTPAPTQQVFRDSARLEAADWFGEGQITWLTGANAGHAMKVKTYAADGTFTLALPMWSTVAIGDTGTAVAGCRKRWEEDCKTKNDNLYNFGGEKDAPGVDTAMSAPAGDV